MQPVWSVLPAPNQVLQILLLSIAIKTQLAGSWLLSSYGFRIQSWKCSSSGRSWLLLFGFFELSALCFVVSDAGWGLVGLVASLQPSESAGRPPWWNGTLSCSAFNSRPDRVLLRWWESWLNPGVLLLIRVSLTGDLASRSSRSEDNGTNTECDVRWNNLRTAAFPRSSVGFSAKIQNM